MTCRLKAYQWLMKIYYGVILHAEIAVPQYRGNHVQSKKMAWRKSAELKKTACNGSAASNKCRIGWQCGGIIGGKWRVAARLQRTWRRQWHRGNALRSGGGAKIWQRRINIMAIISK